MKTILHDRVLWYDGVSEVTEEIIPALFMLGVSPDKIISSGETVDRFNQLSMDEEIASSKTDIVDPTFDWKIPEEYKNLDLRAFTKSKLDSFLVNNSIRSISDYEIRLAAELDEIARRDMDMMIKSVIYVIDVLRRNNEIWGVGRGSSCASLVLFLVGLHCVDPVKFQIPMLEFFHD